MGTTKERKAVLNVLLVSCPVPLSLDRSPTKLNHALLERDEPPRHPHNLQSPFERGHIVAGNMPEVPHLIHTDVSDDLKIATHRRRTTQADSIDGPDETTEKNWRRRVVRDRRISGAVIALALSPVRDVKPERSPRHQRQIRAHTNLIVIAVRAPKSDIVYRVSLGDVRRMISEIRYHGVAGVPSLIACEWKPFRRHGQAVR